MKKKPLAAPFDSPPTVPQAIHIGGITLLSVTVLVHGQHECKPRYVEPVCHPQEHIESDGPRAPSPTGRPTTWVTSTSSAVGSFTASDLATLYIKR